MSDDEEKTESIPTVPVDQALWIYIRVHPEEPLRGTYRHLARLAALGVIIIGTVISVGAGFVLLPLGLISAVVFVLVTWGVFRVARIGLEELHLSGGSAEADRLLELAPDLRALASKRRMRGWVRRLQSALPPGAVIRLSQGEPHAIQAFAAPFEPFSVLALPDWLLSDYEGGDSIDIDEESEIRPVKPAKSAGETAIGGLLRPLRIAAARVVGVGAIFFCLAIFVAVIGYFGYVGWLSFMAIVEFVLHGKAPKFPLIVYVFGACIGWVLMVDFLRSFTQIWMVPGGLVRRVTRPWRRHWDVELFMQRDCILVSDESNASLGSYLVTRDRVFRVNFGMLGPLGALSAWLSPVQPPGLNELTDLR